MMPNGTNSQHQYKKIFNIKIWNDDQREHIFLNSYIYFSFYSNVGMKIITKIRFEEEKTQKKIFRDNVSDNGYNDDNSNFDYKHEKYLQFEEKVRSENKKIRETKNNYFIQRNINTVSYWNQKKIERREINYNKIRLRIKKTHQKKKKIYKKNMTKVKRYIKRWEVIKKIKVLKCEEYHKLEK